MKLLIMLAALTGGRLFASEITLHWQPVENAAGYRIYFGGRPGDYKSIADSPTTSTTLTIPSGRVFISVTAYDIDGYESEHSEEIVYNSGRVITAKTLRVNRIILR